MNITEKTNWDGTKVSVPIMKATLPKPPSINHIYGYTCQKGFARSYITQEGRLWFQEASLRLQAQRDSKKTIETPCEIWIDLYTCRVQDVDNILKPILDLLQKNGVVKNDNLFYKLDVEKYKVAKEDERIELEIMGYA
jgi:Holliday junction resolvase RusA-like endonuclease